MSGTSPSEENGREPIGYEAYIGLDHITNFEPVATFPPSEATDPVDQRMGVKYNLMKEGEDSVESPTRKDLSSINRGHKTPSTDRFKRRELYHPEEQIFITAHRQIEASFLRAVNDIERAIHDHLLAPLGPDDTVVINHVAKAATLVKRSVSYMDMAIDGVKTLQQMKGVDFLRFRHLVEPASGFQSMQFRRIELMLGIRKGDRLPMMRDESIGSLVNQTVGMALERGASEEEQSAFRAAVIAAIKDHLNLEERANKGDEAASAVLKSIDGDISARLLSGGRSSTSDHMEKLAKRRFSEEYMNEWHELEEGINLKEALLRSLAYLKVEKIYPHFVADMTGLSVGQGSFPAIREFLGHPDFANRGDILLLEDKPDQVAAKSKYGINEETEAKGKKALFLVEQFPEAHGLSTFHELVEAILDLDESVRMLHFQHARTVERSIGNRPGTGGSRGIEYLDHACHQTACGMIHRVRTCLMNPEDELLVKLLSKPRGFNPRGIFEAVSIE